MWSRYWIIILLVALASLLYYLYNAPGNLGCEFRGMLNPLMGQIKAILQSWLGRW